MNEAVSALDFNKIAGPLRPVHVAVICPPGAAVTVLLNVMGNHGGYLVMSSAVPMQVGALAKANGHANTVLCPLLIFSIMKSEFEKWLGVTYDAMGAYQMADVIEGKVRDPLGLSP